MDRLLFRDEFVSEALYTPGRFPDKRTGIEWTRVGSVIPGGERSYATVFSYRDASTFFDGGLTNGVFAAHAAPSAFLMFNGGPRHGTAIGEYRGEPLYHASLDPAEYQILLGQFGFDVVAHAVEDPTAGERTVWLAQSRKRL